MTGRALIVKTGDPAIGGVLVDGVLHQEIERLRAENERLRAELGVLKAMEAPYWRRKIAANRRIYRPKEQSRLSKNLLRAWAGLTMGIMGR